jgi:hypothetical protein
MRVGRTVRRPERLVRAAARHRPDGRRALSVDRFGRVVVFAETANDLDVTASLDVMLLAYDGAGTLLWQQRRGSTRYA